MSTREELLAEIAESISPRHIDRDEGWFTIQDVLDTNTDLSRTTTGRKLNRQAQRGELEKASWYDPSVKRIVNCYRKCQ